MNHLNNLVTTYSFRSKEYLVSLNAPKQNPGIMEIKVTDKRTTEEWLGSFNASYIENLTQKTGNYKRFDTFMAMVKSGLLNTSQCVTLDLLTYEDLEMLKSKGSQSRFTGSYSTNNPSVSCNKRYLIVTYTVEFDRIHFPLALEYCGPPDPKILQETITRLEKQVVHLQHQLDKKNNWEEISGEIESLQRKVVEVTSENIMLKEHLGKLNSKTQYSLRDSNSYLKSIRCLETKLKNESEKVEVLRIENANLSFKLEESLRIQKLLRTQLNSLNSESNFSKSKDNKSKYLFKPPSPLINRSFDTVKPFRRRPLENKVNSARSHLGFVNSSSDESVFGNGSKVKQNLKFSSKIRASSPTLSDVSHNSTFSRCACRGCLRLKYGQKEDLRSLGNNNKSKNAHGKTTLLKRIQSLEKLISGMVLK